jgi:hypothetical protein
MGRHHHVNIVNVLLPKKGSNLWTCRALTSVDQDVKVAVIMQQNGIALSNVDKKGAEVVCGCRQSLAQGNEEDDQ